VQCRRHADREAVAVCQKHRAGFCTECCECLDAQRCCECLDPKVYCQFRTQCLIWELARERRRQGA